MGRFMTESTGKPAIRPGRTAERVGVFTDAVFAIAMTLLVIEIPRPEAADFEPGHGVSKSLAFHRLGHFLAQQESAFYAYLLAFYLIWIVWRQHHVLFDQIDRVSGGMVALHFPLLLLAAFLPYVSTVLGHYPDNPLAALLFGLVFGLLLACRAAIQTLAGRDDEVLQPEVDRRQHHVTVVVAWAVIAYWALTLLFVWWAPWTEIPWFLTGLVANLVGRIYQGGGGKRLRIRPS
jgi:uncharacterized membrane protein